MSIDFNNKAPQWNNAGTEPKPDEINSGYVPGDKVPADYLNYHLNRLYLCIEELQAKLSNENTSRETAQNAHTNNKDNPHQVTVEKIGAAKKDLSNVDDTTFKKKLEEPVLNRITYKLSTSIKDYALTLEEGFYAVHLSGASYTGADLPEGNYKYSSAIIYVRKKSDVISIMLLGTTTSPPQFAHCDAGTWGEWSTHFLSLSGGILKGNLDLKKVDNGSATIYKNHGNTSDYGLLFRDVDIDGNYNQLMICAKENTLKYRDTTGKTNYLYGEHNLTPLKIETGSFSGSGATSKTITCANIEPKLIFVTNETNAACLVGVSSSSNAYMVGSTTKYGASFSGKSFTYSVGSNSSMNLQTHGYKWWAIGY